MLGMICSNQDVRGGSCFEWNMLRMIESGRDDAHEEIDGVLVYVCDEGECGDRNKTDEIVRTYRKRGIEAACDIVEEGILVLYDKSRNLFCISRDFTGYSSIFFTWAPDGGLVFSNSVKDILLNSPNVCFDEDVIRDKIVNAEWYPNGDKTIFKGLFKLEPGTCLVVEMDGGRIKKHYINHWYNLPREIKLRSYKEARDGFYRTLDNAIRRRTSPSFENYLLFSGGRDSMVVLDRMSHVHDKPPITGTLSTTGETDEDKNAKRLAQIYGAKNEPIMLDPSLANIEDLFELNKNNYIDLFRQWEAMMFTTWNRNLKREGRRIFHGDSIGYHNPRLKLKNILYYKSVLWRKDSSPTMISDISSNLCPYHDRYTDTALLERRMKVVSEMGKVRTCGEVFNVMYHNTYRQCITQQVESGRAIWSPGYVAFVLQDRKLLDYCASLRLAYRYRPTFKQMIKSLTEEVKPKNILDDLKKINPEIKYFSTNTMSGNFSIILHNTALGRQIAELLERPHYTRHKEIEPEILNIIRWYKKEQGYFVAGGETEPKHRKIEKALALEILYRVHIERSYV